MLKHRVSSAGMQNAPPPPPLQTEDGDLSPDLPPDLPLPPPPDEDVSSADHEIVQNNIPGKDNSYEQIEGLRRINEKYDSLGVNRTLSFKTKPSSLGNSPSTAGAIPGSPVRSVGSPLIENSHFMFPDSQKFREGVTEHDLLQVETFYKSHKSEVYVCGCLANMYMGSSKPSFTNDQWLFTCTGILTLLLDTGEHHRARKLYILIAEKGTGFALWRDVIDNQTGYKAPNANFHTMHTSSDHSKLAGFSFDDAGSAATFFSHIDKLTSNPHDDLLKIGKTKKKKSVKDKKKKVKLPKKSEISQPCCFVHVTKIDRPMNVTEDNEPTEHISQPFNFSHLSAQSGTGNGGLSPAGSLTNVMGSKLTLTSTESVDSGLSEDRSSAKTEKS